MRGRRSASRISKRARHPRSTPSCCKPPRVAPPPALAAICTSEKFDRAQHTYGKSFLDYVRGLAGDYANAPDVVAYPRNEADVAALLDWAGGAGAAVIPFGGGSSVVGGVEPRLGDNYKAALTIDLRNLNRVVEIDKVSRAARIEGGTFGPALEAQLKPHGLTLRHFPQSFEYSTLGGWIATRGGGHFASLYTHIDDFVESLRMVTPQGRIETRRLPGSGAGPSPDRMFIGSEGILGIITEAWMRLQDRPRFRAGGAVRFKDLFTAARALRAISQAGLYPANCRILDPERGAQHRRRRRQLRGHGAGVRIRPTTRSGRGRSARSNSAPITAARPKRPKAPTRRRTAPPGCGATPLSACPMRARKWWRAPSSATRSRPRSPGSGSSISMTR